jgi:hypothetical protein
MRHNARVALSDQSPLPTDKALVCDLQREGKAALASREHGLGGHRVRKAEGVQMFSTQ